MYELKICRSYLGDPSEYFGEGFYPYESEPFRNLFPNQSEIRFVFRFMTLG